MALHYVYLSARQVLCVRAAGRGLVMTGRFDVPAGESIDPAEFLRLLSAHRRDRFVVIADVVDEELQLETVPRVKRADRMTLIARRLEQRFRDRPLRTSMPLTPPKGVRPVVPVGAEGPEPVLLAALGNESGVQVWLAAMQAAGARVVGLHSPAMLAPSALARVGKGLSGLLVTVQPGGIRQTLVVDGRMRFSRLAALNPQGVNGATVGAECERTLQYLAMNKMLPAELLRADAARVWCVIDGLQDAAALPESVGADTQHRLPLLRIRSAQLRGPTLSAELVALFGGAGLWLDQGLMSGDGYADAPLLRHARVAHWRQWLFTASGGAFATCAMAWLAVWNIGLIGDTTTQQERERRHAEDRQQYEAGLAVAGIGGNEMRQLVETADRIAQRGIDPVRVLERIAQGLGEDPSLRLVSIAWQRGVAKDQTAALAASVSTPVTLVPAASALPSMTGGAVTPLPPPGATTPAPAATAAGDDALAVTVKAQVLRVESRVDANRRAQAFAERLRKGCGCEVMIKSLPFESSGAGGTAPGAESASSRAGFTVTLDLDRRVGDTLVGGTDARRS